MAHYEKEILKVGASLAIRPTIGVNTPFEYFPLSMIKGVTGRFEANFKANGFQYRFADMAKVTIDFNDHSWQSLEFDVQDISNQATWLGTEVGVAQAVEDINSWITLAAGGGGSPTPVVPGSLVLNENDALGGDGTDFINLGSGLVVGVDYKYLVANEDCTFTTLVGSTTPDLLAALPTGLGITTDTIGKGMIIRGLNGETITEVEMLTGSVLAIR